MSAQASLITVGFCKRKLPKQPTQNEANGLLTATIHRDIVKVTNNLLDISYPKNKKAAEAKRG